jgi:hypothetical protein
VVIFSADLGTEARLTEAGMEKEKKEKNDGVKA